MKTVNVREFGLLYDRYEWMHNGGCEFIFTLDNQSDAFKNRCRYVSGDRRVFDSMLMALNPDAIKFGNSQTGEHFTISGIDHIDMDVGYVGADEWFFDVVCDINHIGKEAFTFLVRKKV